MGEYEGRISSLSSIEMHLDKLSVYLLSFVTGFSIKVYSPLYKESIVSHFQLVVYLNLNKGIIQLHL